MQPLRVRRCSVILSLTVAFLSACDRSPTSQESASGPTTAGAKVQQAREVMGTFAEVTAVASDQARAAQAVEAAYEAFDRVNRLMSDYRDDSEISRLNRQAADDPLSVSAETFACLRAAQTVAAQSAGAFDVTCRPLTVLWRQAAAEKRLPTTAELTAVRERVGYEKMTLDPRSQTVTLAAPNMQIDLGGIAKGYALDLAAKAMQAAGATAGLVDIGGDVYCFGANPAAEAWRVGVKHPTAAGTFSVLAIRDRAVATSGIQQRFFEVDGQRYSHIIDPRTGQPAEQAASVTVIAPTGMEADAWATALSVMTIAEGRQLAESLPGVEVLWLSPDPSGGLREAVTSGIDSFRLDQHAN